MRPVLMPSEMAEADRRAIASGTSEAVLVARAARAVARHARRMLGGAYGRRVVVACGKGNNGADGALAAGLLQRRGIGADVFSLADGLDRNVFGRALDRADLFVDAMFGTGFRGTLEGDAEWVAGRTAESGARTLAIDIPSGVDGATGAVEGVAVRADETVCFAALKPGLLFEQGRSYAGRVHVEDIGIAIGTPTVWAPGVESLRLPERDPTSHKWSSALLVFGGSTGMTGAPLMVGRAAARTGATMVVCALPGQDAAARASGSEIVTRVMPSTSDGSMDEDAARVALKDIGRFHALAIGPGLGRDDRAQAAARRLIAEAPIPVVADADALNAIAIDPSSLRVRRAAGLVAPILTPHAGEYERLAGQPVGADRIASARDLATRTGAIVLLKGPGTVIADPGGRAFINVTDGPALATAGTGDVLTGMIGGLLANGTEPFVAAVTGAYVQGRAARAAGTAPDLVASDLINALHRTLEALRTGLDPWEE